MEAGLGQSDTHPAKRVQQGNRSFQEEAGGSSAATSSDLARQSFHESAHLGFADIALRACRIGNDVEAVLTGGMEHIGCAVLATPRPSLAEDGKTSATASVLNVSGHKDDIVCRLVAERASAALNCTVVCTGGIQIDCISAGQIQAVTNAAEALCEKLIAAFARR